jgi:5-methylcytosine-specific restriction protein A
MEIRSTCITCGTLIPHGASRCPRHRGKAWVNRPKINQGTYSGDWPAIRARVLQRDRYRCQVQGPGCDGHGVEADHIVSVADGGNNDPTNLRAICVACHRRRTGQQGARAAKARRQADVIPMKPRPRR